MLYLKSLKCEVYAIIEVLGKWIISPLAIYSFEESFLVVKRRLTILQRFFFAWHALIPVIAKARVWNPEGWSFQALCHLPEAKIMLAKSLLWLIYHIYNFFRFGFGVQIILVTRNNAFAQELKSAQGQIDFLKRQDSILNTQKITFNISGNKFPVPSINGRDFWYLVQRRVTAIRRANPKGLPLEMLTVELPTSNRECIYGIWLKRMKFTW